MAGGNVERHVRVEHGSRTETCWMTGANRIICIELN